jgi:hypothetical protein
MKMNKVLPVLLLILMAVVTIIIRHYSKATISNTNRRVETRNGNRPNRTRGPETAGLDRNPSRLFFTRHARCRMHCRHITHQEVKDILINGTINYNKSDLQDSRSPSYAVEGMTKDRQHVRIIFAPKSQHLAVVTVIDLDMEYECNCT